MKDISILPAGKRRINILEASEVNEWTRRFGVTRERLIAAVKEVGKDAGEVEMFLKKGLKSKDSAFRRLDNYSIL